jgi:ParB-like chromosome segregation protein Spo0J
MTKLPLGKHMLPTPFIRRDYKRELDPKIVKAMEENIRNTRKVEPLVIDEDGFIIDGEHRYMAAARAGLSEIPCIVRER